MAIYFVHYNFERIHTTLALYASIARAYSNSEELGLARDLVLIPEGRYRDERHDQRPARSAPDPVGAAAGVPRSAGYRHRQGPLSPFKETAFLEALRQLRADARVITGGETDVCVLAAVPDDGRVRRHPLVFEKSRL